MTANPQEARLTYVFRCKAKAKKEYKKGAPIPIDEYEGVIYGGETESREPFEYDQLQKISLELLGALRDAERDLEPSARSRTAHLLRNFEASVQDKRDVTTMIEDLNERLSKAGQVSEAQKAVNARLKDLVGETSAQETRLTPIGTDYDDLVRNIKVEVRSTGEEFRGIDWNGLGYNNLLFVSVLLADHLQKWQKRKLVLPMMAIEEPEAHLHPHLQKVLNRNFERTVQRAQVIATTHSTHIASSVSLDSLVVLNRDENGVLQGVKVGDLFGDSKADCRLKKDLERYLDATKSTLFFAKSVLLVEGLAEVLIIPILARMCAQKRFDLDEEGISVVAVYGLSFRPFLQLFGPDAIHRRCAVLTDSDPKEYSLDIDNVTPNPTAAGLIQDFGDHDNPYVSVLTNLKTFEYDLAVATSGDAKDPNAPLSNEGYILRALQKTLGVIQKNIPGKGSIPQRNEFGKTIAELVEGAKGRFAQALASEIDEGFVTPSYIQNAFNFLLGVK
jgi:putative ATP-dependent endonuclease of OLD family